LRTTVKREPTVRQPMRFRFVLDGPKYSRHKAALKEMLREHRLAWRGNMTEFVWIGPRDRVRAEFDRDAAKDVTVRATITWDGKAKTPLLNELKTWAFSLRGTTEEVRAPKPSASAAKERSDRLERELDLWDRLHRPDVEALRTAGRPAEWIERDLREWKKAREAKRRELVRTLGDQ